MQAIIDFTNITDWSSFHSAFQACMGFPAFYGRNMDAWIDCMYCIDKPETEMTRVTVNPGESLEIMIFGTEAAWKRCPEVLQKLLECTAFVNRRFIESNSGTRLKLIVT